MERTGRLTTPRAQRVRRSRGARAIVILTVLFLTGALARLQVVNGDELAKTSRTNRMRPLSVPAPPQEDNGRGGSRESLHRRR